MLLNTLRPFLPFLYKYRREVAIGMAALLLTDVAQLAIPWILKVFVDVLPQKPESATLLKYTGLLFLVAVVQAVSRFGWRKYLFGPSRKIEIDILNSLFSHFLTLDQAYYQNQKIGDLMSRATNDLRAVRDFMGLGLLILADCIVVIVSSIGLMLLISSQLTLMVMLPLPLVSILFFKFVKKISLRHQAVQEHLAEITSLVQENIAGIRVLHAFAQEEYQKKKFDGLNREYIHKNLQVTKLFGIFTPSLVFTIGVAALISLWMGGKTVIAGEITLGEFVAFNGYLMMLSWPMMGIGYVVNLTQKGKAAMGRIQEILSARPVVQDHPEMDERFELKGSVEIKNLNFTYPGSDKKSLDDITLNISQGETLAVVGRVGSGKSTLAQLIPRLYEANWKSVLIGGVPVESISLSRLREHIGYVDQDPFLFTATVRENIMLGNDGADVEEIDEAVRCSGLLPDLERFPNGLNTVVGERGVSLSGGQKQRIALARALLKKSPILILDDAFSSLDAETEDTIMKNIKNYTQGITTVLITHRLGAVREADQIVVMENGKIVERGNYRELMESNGIYARTFKNQALAHEMEILLQ